MYTCMHICVCFAIQNYVTMFSRIFRKNAKILKVKPYVQIHIVKLVMAPVSICIYKRIFIWN